MSEGLRHFLICFFLFGIGCGLTSLYFHIRDAFRELPQVGITKDDVQKLQNEFKVQQETLQHISAKLRQS